MSIQIDPKISGLLRGLKIRQTTPLAQRAFAAAQARTISLEQARALGHLDRFELGGNQFQIFCPKDFNNHELTALVVSHFGSAFKGQSIGIYLSQFSKNGIFVTLEVARSGSEFSLTLFGPGKTATELFNLNFQVHKDHIEMSKLESKMLGKGGAALLALYNIARGSGTKVIKYCVRGGNLPAKRFYAQMGFGVPVDPQCTMWEVEVESCQDSIRLDAVFR